MFKSNKRLKKGICDDERNQARSLAADMVKGRSEEALSVIFQVDFSGAL